MKFSFLIALIGTLQALQLNQMTFGDADAAKPADGEEKPAADAKADTAKAEEKTKEENDAVKGQEEDGKDAAKKHEEKKAADEKELEDAKVSCANDKKKEKAEAEGLNKEGEHSTRSEEREASNKAMAGRLKENHEALKKAMDTPGDKATDDFLKTMKKNHARDLE